MSIGREGEKVWRWRNHEAKISTKAYCNFLLFFVGILIYVFHAGPPELFSVCDGVTTEK